MSELEERSGSWERIAAFAFGVVFLLLLLGVVLFFKHPTEFQKNIITIVLALAGAGVAAMLPGSLRITANNYVKAGGAIAVFIIIYFFVPAQFVENEKKTENPVPSSTQTEPQQNAEKQQDKIVQVYNTLVTRFYKITSQYNELDTRPNLIPETRNSALSLVEEVNTINDRYLTVGLRIERHYILANLKFISSDTTEENKQKIILANECIEEAKIALALIEQVKRRAANADSESRTIFSWIIKENLKERVTYFYALSLAIKALSGEQISKNEIETQMNSIPAINRTKYSLDSNPLLVSALEKLTPSTTEIDPANKNPNDTPDEEKK
ncbi:MAG: hypothetical protein AAF518_21450 [Spirochaetota bacterium]